MIPVEGIDHVALSVRDPLVSATWYRELFGLERRYEESWGDMPVVVCAGDACLALFPVEGASPKPPPGRDVIAMRHVAFRVSGEIFAHVEDELRARGIGFEPADHGIARSIYVRDPDGHLVEITTYAP